jgi:hypothetical protein
MSTNRFVWTTRTASDFMDTVAHKGLYTVQVRFRNNVLAWRELAPKRGVRPAPYGDEWHYLAFAKIYPTTRGAYVACDTFTDAERDLIGSILISHGYKPGAYIAGND